MAGFMKNAMSYLGMADPAEDEDMYDYDDESQDQDDSSFDADTPIQPQSTTTPDISAGTRSASITPLHPQMSKILTIAPKAYHDAEAVGRAIRSGVPVILDLSNTSDAEAYRIIDFSSGVVFGLRGKIDTITSRVYVLTPAQVELEKPEHR